MYSKFEIIGNT